MGEITRHLRRFRAELVLSYTPKIIAYGTFAARLAGARRVHALMTGLGTAFIDERPERRLVNSTARTLLGAALRMVDGVIFQNPDDRDELHRRGVLGKRARVALVAGSGIDTAHFAHVPPPAPPPRFLLVARVQREKGVLEYAEAARALRASHPEVEVRLVGPLDSHPAAVSEAVVRGWERDGALAWAGPVDDVRPELERASVYVLPSYREGTPRSVLEALSVGRAIVTTDAPGCRETVRHGDNGFLVPVRDPGALRAAMERFVREPELIPRMGQRSRALAEARYDVRKVNAAMVEALGLG